MVQDYFTSFATTAIKWNFLCHSLLRPPKFGHKCPAEASRPFFCSAQHPGNRWHSVQCSILPGSLYSKGSTHWSSENQKMIRRPFERALGIWPRSDDICISLCPHTVFNVRRLWLGYWIKETRYMLVSLVQIITNQKLFFLPALLAQNRKELLRSTRLQIITSKQQDLEQSS